MKVCTTCNKNKKDSEFNKKGTSFQAKCKQCNSDYLKEHYKASPDYYLKKNQKRKAETRLFITSLRLKCSKCPEDHPSCLDFHHLGDKELNIAEMANQGASKQRILKEVSKCVVLCSNCHRKLHYEERNCPVV